MTSGKYLDSNKNILFSPQTYIPCLNGGLSVSSSPGGNDRYLAILRYYLDSQDITPQEVHDIGKAQVEKLKTSIQKVTNLLFVVGRGHTYLSFN